jgi:hypothetical protein
MTDQRIDSAVASDLTTQVTDYSVDTASTDGAFEQRETTWTNTEASQYLGYYKKIPECRSVIDARATWTIGKGFKADEITTMLLDTIEGISKDTFNSILENLVRDMQIYGDAYAQIVLDDEDNLINLKVLDPAVMVHVVNQQGQFIRYEQNSKVKGQPPKKFAPEKIFHIMRNRVADEIHGTSLIEALEWIILAKNEAMADMKQLMHRHVRPLFIFHLDTDDPTEIATYKSTNDALTGKGENLYVPKDVVVPELMAVAPNSTLNPIPWLNYLDEQFYETSQTPKIILGGSGEFTEASAKIAYLAFQQSVEEDQLAIEEQVLKQLNVLIELEFPVSLENELLSDKAKDQEQGAVQPNDTTAGRGE